MDDTNQDLHSPSLGLPLNNDLPCSGRGEINSAMLIDLDKVGANIQKSSEGVAHRVYSIPSTANPGCGKSSQKLHGDGDCDDSLSLVDFDAVDDPSLFQVADLADGDFDFTPPRKKPLVDLRSEIEYASPIPLAPEDGPRIMETPAHNEKASIPFISLASQWPGRLLSTSSSTVTLTIETESIIASTPFRHRPTSAYCSAKTNPHVNTTYNVEDTGKDGRGRALMNVTYDGESAVKNTTFTAVTKESLCNAIFNKPATKNMNVGKVNETFEVITSTAAKTGATAPGIPSTTTVAQSSQDTEMKSTNTSNETGTRSLRKPLSVLNNKSKFGLHRVTAAQSSQKRVSCLQPPGIKAAALSHIQMQCKKLEKQDENISVALKPPSGTLKKPANKRQTLGSRRSLLPPPSSRPRQAASPVAVKGSSNIAASAASVKTIKDQSLESKKKDLPKSQITSRTSKSDSTSAKSGISSSLLRNSGHVTSRIASINSRPSSKLHKPFASSRLSLLPGNKIISDSSTNESSTSRSRTTGQKRSQAANKNQVAPKRTPAKQNQLPAINDTSHCVVALATLLDYVVNRLDGLSAPRLSSDKQHLEKLVKEKSRSNLDLSSRIGDLESALEKSRDAHESDVKTATNLHEKEVRELKENHEAEERNLVERRDELLSRLETQKRDHKKTAEDIEEKHRNIMQEMERKYEEDVAQLRHEWSEEREKMEQETLDLRERMDEKVQAKVEMLIQPYLDSYEENKSLRSVLEMKTTEQNKMRMEISQQGEQLGEIRSLRDQVIRLQQRNEDLQTQVNDKTTEQRDLREEVTQLRRNLDEQQYVTNTQQQQIEELKYRLNTSSPTPSSPFNPVFTPSPNVHPSTSGSGLFLATSPKTSQQGEDFLQNCDVTGQATSRENGTM